MIPGALSGEGVRGPEIRPVEAFGPLIRKTIVAGVIAASVLTLADWGIVRAIYGDRFAGHAGLNIRFGPNATTRPRK